MDNFHYHYKKVVLIAAITMLVASGLWFINPNSLIAGFVLGTAFGMIGTYILYRNVVYVTEVVAVDPQSRVKASGIGLRILLVVSAVYIASKSADINVYTTIVGLFFTQIIAYIYFLVESIKN